MAYRVYRGATFLVPSGSTKDQDALHLHVVSTSPCADGQCLLLTISTIREGIWYDDTRLIHAGSHEFIQENSYVNYRYAVIKKCVLIAKMVDGWVYHTKRDFSNDLTDFVLSGVRESDMTPCYVLDYLDSLGL